MKETKNMIMKSLLMNFDTLISQIQTDFPYYKPLNVEKTNKIDFIINGYRYELYGSNLEHSNVHIRLYDNDNNILKDVKNFLNYRISIKNGNTYFKSLLIYLDTNLYFYDKFIKSYPDLEDITFPMPTADSDKLFIRYNNKTVFSVVMPMHYFYGSVSLNNYLTENKPSLLYMNILTKDKMSMVEAIRTNNYSFNFNSNNNDHIFDNYHINFESIKIDTKILEYKMFFNKRDYVYSKIIEPLLDERVSFLEHKNNFKSLINGVKDNIESSNFVRKMKIDTLFD